MKFIKLTLFVMAALFSYACSHTNHLQKTVWISVSQVEENKSTALISTLEFVTDSNVDIYNAVTDDTKTLVKPYVYAKGSYELIDRGSKEMEISIKAESIDGKPLNYRGLYRKNKAIVLENENKTINLYGKSRIKIQ